MSAQEFGLMDEIKAQVTLGCLVIEVICRLAEAHGASECDRILFFFFDQAQGLAVHAGGIGFGHLLDFDGISLDSLKERIVETIGGSIKHTVFSQLIREFPIRVGFHYQRGGHDLTYSFQTARIIPQNGSKVQQHEKG